MIDFGKMKRPAAAAKPIDPEEIFRQLPKTPNTPNDLWRGQTDALREWHANRENSDVLISLNTGAGKTLVGLLIAQSLVNEATENVLYLCSTIDLINQTAREAEKLGLKYSTRVSGDFNNDLFESGKTFCITTYASAFQPFSVFLRRFRPSAIIFDDAHVAEKLLRDAYTLRIVDRHHKDIADQIRALFVEAFKEANRLNEYRDIVSGKAPGLVMAPPNAVALNAGQITEILRQADVQNQDLLKYPWGHLKDHIAHSAIVFASGGLEIAPPFLPVLALPFFGQSHLRRVYLSATLNYQSDLARAFGRLPKVTIAPKNDAGEGERLILFAKNLKAGEVTATLASAINRKHKWVVAVRSYQVAEKWKEFSQPPDTKAFSEALDEFRRAKKGSFILVSRVDGIDLPDDTCRVMIVDGLPSGSSLLEQYQWDNLQMRNFHAARLANRVTQLFGRINRGRKDYGVFIVNGKDVSSWLSNDRNIALLPPLLQKQLLLAEAIDSQLQIRDERQVVEAIDKVVSRSEDWVDFYSESIVGLDVAQEDRKRATVIEKAMTTAALAEAKFARAIWDGDIAGARNELESVVDEVTRSDPRLGGWYKIWIGTCLEMEGDVESAQFVYEEAKQRLLTPVALPRRSAKAVTVEDDFGKTASKMIGILNATTEASFQKQMRQFRTGLRGLEQADASSNQVEESLRYLGEMLGYQATRPDNDGAGGPDVMWYDADSKYLILIEAKTDKKDSATYKREDIAKAHNFLQWAKDNYPADHSEGIIIVGPDGKRSDKAYPDDNMYLCALEVFHNLAERFLVGVEDIRKKPPTGRQLSCREFVQREGLELSRLFQRFAVRRLRDLRT